MKPGWQVMLVPRAMVIREGSLQPGVPRQPWNFEPLAACADSCATVPATNEAVQTPVLVPALYVQLMPVGCEVTVPPPLPADSTERLPVEKVDGVRTVMIPYVVTPPAVPMMSADWGFDTVSVVTGKVALREPAGTVRLAGTVAAARLSLDSVTPRPPEGAEADSVAVPVTGVPPRTSVALRVIDDNEGEALATVPGLVPVPPANAAGGAASATTATPRVINRSAAFFIVTSSVARVRLVFVTLSAQGRHRDRTFVLGPSGHPGRFTMEGDRRGVKTYGSRRRMMVGTDIRTASHELTDAMTVLFRRWCCPLRCWSRTCRVAAAGVWDRRRWVRPSCALRRRTACGKRG